MKRKNPYRTFAKGGSWKELYNYVLSDEPDDDDPPKTDTTAPSEEELPQQQHIEQPEEDDFDLAMQLAMQQDEHQVTRRNPYGDEVQRSIGVNPYVQKTEKDLLGLFPLQKLGIWGDQSHQQRKSDHNTGDAEDFGVSDPNVASQVIGKLQSEAPERNVKYIIYNGKIWNPSKGWSDYTGKDSHKSHIHVSYKR